MIKKSSVLLISLIGIVLAAAAFDRPRPNHTKWQRFPLGRDTCQNRPPRRMKRGSAARNLKIGELKNAFLDVRGTETA